VTLALDGVTPGGGRAEWSGTMSSDAARSDAPSSAAPAIRLVATDLDGTLLRHDKRVSRGTLAALADARAAGLAVIAATGRQADQLPELIGATGISHAVASNGAIAVDLRDGRILFEDLLTVEAQAAVVDHFAATLPGVRYASVRDQGAGHLAEAGYLDLMSPGLPELPADFFEPTGLAVVVSEPTLKLTARHPDVSPDELLARLQEAGLPGCHGTTSGAPFLEIQGAGVTKAAGVSRLARLLGVEPAEVMAVGDARNDVELREWAGVGVAMGNAVPEAFEVADWTTATNEADGLALAIRWVLERRDGC
jgi:hydroxymethylpyrimidine pyrophosphatase-like HAD family hydrolase